MNLETIQALSNCRFGKYFLTRSYSLEMLLYLLEHKEAEGIEEFLSALKSTTPKLPAFLSFISLLEAKNCVIRAESKSKKSKRTVALTPECLKAIKQYLD